jgi:uncharacterized membrane protein YfcA
LFFVGSRTLTMSLLLALGIVAGILTTVAGMGGGLLLVSVVGLLRGPHEALALTSPALMLSNLHRTWMFRASVDRRVAMLVAAGTVPGALLGGLLLSRLPGLWVTGLMLATTVIALLRARGLVKLRVGRGALFAAGSAIGALAATSGGAGFLIAPLLMSSGLRGQVYVATISCCAVALHLGRILGYGLSGLLRPELLQPTAVLLAGLLIGNVIASRLRSRIPGTLEPKLELAALLITTLFSLVGVAR